MLGISIMNILILVLLVLLLLYLIARKDTFINETSPIFTDNEWKKLTTIKNPYLDNIEFLWLDENIEFYKKNYPASPSFDFEIKQDIIAQALKIPINYAIVDCGAHIGDGAIPIAHALKHLDRPDIMVYAIDPSLYKCEVIKYLAEKNNLTNITVITSGLSDNTNEYSKPKLDTLNTGGIVWNVTKENDDHDEKIHFNTLDNIVNMYNIDNIGVIHLDVQTMEIQALKGAVNIINKSKPYLTLENDESPETMANTDYYIPYLPIGYKYLYNKGNNNCLKFI